VRRQVLSGSECQLKLKLKGRSQRPNFPTNNLRYKYKMSSGNQAKRARVALSQSSLAQPGQLLTVSHRK